MNDEKQLSPVEKISLGLSSGKATQARSGILDSSEGSVFQVTGTEKISQGLAAQAEEKDRVEQIQKNAELMKMSPAERKEKWDASMNAIGQKVLEQNGRK